MTKRLIVGLLLFAAPSLCAAQSPGAKPQPTPTRAEGSSAGSKTESAARPPAGPTVPPALRAGVKPAVLPPDKDAWIVQVMTGGGFSGKGKGDVTVSSDGSAACSLPDTPCESSLTPELLKSLGESVREAKPEKWGDFGSGTCNDCYATSLVLRRRGKHGAERVYTANWDDASKDLPADVKRIYENALKVAAVGK